MANAGELSVDLTAKTASFESGIKRSGKAVSGFEKMSKKSFGGVNTAMRSLGTTIVGLVGAAGFGALIKSQIDAGDEAQKLSIRLGASTEALTEYMHVADLTGVGVNTLTMGWQRQTRRIADAAQGTGEAKNALLELGLSAQALNQLAPEQQFEILADSIMGVRNESDRVRLAMKLWDSEGVSLLQTISGGSEGLREMRQEARELGLSLNRAAADDMAAANDAMVRMKSSVTGVARAMAVQLAPVVVELADWMRDALPKAMGFASKGFDVIRFAVLSFVESVANGLAKIMDISARASELVGLDKLAAKYRAAAESVRFFSDSVAQSNLEAALGVSGGGGSGPFSPGTGNLPGIPDGFDPALAPEVVMSSMISDELTRLESEKQDALTLMSQKGYRERLEFAQMTEAKKTQTILGEMVNLTQGVTRQSKALFNLNKLAGISNAIVNAYIGISKTLAAYPYPYNLGMAALHGVSAFAQVRAIGATSFGSGGGAPSLSGSGASPVVPVDSQGATAGGQAPRQVDIYIAGGLTDSNAVRDLIEKINNEVGDGVTLTATVTA